MRHALLFAVLAMAGCYDPNYGNGELACSVDGTCPKGLTCNPSDNRCYKAGSGPVDAAGADAPPDALVETVPDVTISQPTAGSTTGATVAVMFSSSVGFTYECTMDASVSTCDSGKSYTLTSGTHTFSVRAVAPHGTPGKQSSVTWNVDAMAATVTISGGPDELSYTATKTANYVFSAQPADGVVFQCKLDSDPFASCTSPKSMTNLSEGTHAFTVQANRLGALSSTSRTWTVDSLPPGSPTLTGTPANSALVNSGTASFMFSATDANTITYECNRDGGGYAVCTSPQAFSVTGDGAHSFAVRAKDPAGNVTAIGSRSWTLDATAPDTTLTQDVITATNQKSVTFTYSSTEPNSTFNCTLDGVARTCTGVSHTVSGLAVGNHTFSIKAVDAAGNVDPSPATWTFSVTTGPVLRYEFENHAFNNTGAAANTPVNYAGTASTMGVIFTVGRQGDGIVFNPNYGGLLTLPVSPLLRTGHPQTVSIWYRELNPVAGATLIRFPGPNPFSTVHEQANNTWLSCLEGGGCSTIDYTTNSIFHNLIYRYTGAPDAIEMWLDGVYVKVVAAGHFQTSVFATFDNPSMGQGGNMIIDDVRFFDTAYPADQQCMFVLDGTWNSGSSTCSF